MAAVALDVCVRHACVQGHRRRQARRRVLFARRVHLRQGRPQAPRRRGGSADRRGLAVPGKGPRPQGLPRDGRVRGQTQPAHPKVQGRLHLFESARLCRRYRLRAAQQGAQDRCRAVDDEARRVLAVADPARPGVGDAARRHRDPEDLDHRVRPTRLGRGRRRSALVLHGRSERARRIQAGMAVLRARAHGTARREGLRRAGGNVQAAQQFRADRRASGHPRCRIEPITPPACNPVRAP